MKWLLVLHFPKPEEALKQQKVKGSDIAELLPTILRQSEARHWSTLPQMPALKQLFVWTTAAQVSAFDLQETVRNAVLEVLHLNCFCETYQFTSRDDDEVFCKVTCEEAVLRHQAHRIHYPLSLSPAVETNPEFQKMLPHAPYDANRDKEGLFRTYDKSLFRDVDKIRLVKSLLDEHLCLDRMIEKGLLLDCFPIHEEKQLNELRSTLISSSFTLPLSQLREYYGEKMSFYFLWLSSYNSWLFILAVMGVFLWVTECLAGRDRSGGMCFLDWVELSFAVVVGLWTPAFNTFWQRRANYHAVKWGTYSHDEEKVPRAEFKGELRPSKMAPGMELYFSPKERLFRQVISYCTTFFMCGLVVVMVMAISIYKAILIQAGNHQFGVTLCAIINTVQIIGMNIVYDKLALKLNEWENYQHTSDYENALVVKKVGYQFVNYYISLFYIAFVKEHFEGCVHGDCMGELRSSLWVYYLINVIFNFIELGLPIISQKRVIAAEQAKADKMKQEGKATRSNMTYTEGQGKLEHIEFLGEYLEVVMNHGYVVFFCVAFPLGPLIYWIYNLVELRADAFKFLYLSKRPFPESAGGIGVWTDVMNALAVVGVISNIGLMVFTENMLNLSVGARWCFFIVLEHAVLLLVALYLGFAPKITETVTTALGRHKYLLKLKYYGVMSDDGASRFQGTAPPLNTKVNSDE